MSDSLRVPKQAVSIQLRDARGVEHSASIYLADNAAADERRERLQDVLLSRRFIPVASGGAFAFVHRDHILWVRLDLIAAFDELDHDAEGAEGSVAVGVRIELLDGSVVEGGMRYLRPADSRRVSDHLESLPCFFTVQTPDWLYVINRDGVIRLVAVDEVR